MFQYSQHGDARGRPETIVRPPPPRIHHAFLMLGPNLRVLGFDEGASAMFGYERADLLGMHVTELLPELALPKQRADTWLEGCAMLKFSRVALQARHAEGSLFPVLASLLQDAERNLLLRIRTLEP